MTIQAFFSGLAQAAFAATDVPQASEAALAYHAASNAFWVANKTIVLALPALLLLTGLGARMYAHIAGRCKHRALPSIAIFAAIYFTLDQCLRAIVDHFWSAAYSHASQTPPPAWGIGKLGEAIPVLVAMTLAAMIGYTVLTRAPRRAWIVLATAASLLFVGALLVEPYTQSHAPLGTSPIERRLADAGAQVGIAPDRIVLEACQPADACPPGRVIGVGPTRLMLINASLMRTNPPEWTLQTFAHEAKHFVEDDNMKAIFILVSLSFSFAWLIHFLGGAFSRRCRQRFGFTTIVEPASLPLVVVLFTLLQLAVLPPLNAYRQHVELEADRFALEMTRQNAVQAAMIAGHARGALAVPESSLFAKWFRNSHPSDADRIRLANSYRPWVEGAPLQYGQLLQRVDIDESGR